MNEVTPDPTTTVTVTDITATRKVRVQWGRDPEVPDLSYPDFRGTQSDLNGLIAVLHGLPDVKSVVVTTTTTQKWEKR